MKFMKLGSKPDSFHTDGENIRYVASELATDIIINVGDVKFYLHKFPLLLKSARLQKLVSAANLDNIDEIEILDMPGGPATFEICAKFCYGMIATLNAYNVVAARCAAEYLEMYENVEKGNLVYKIEVFLSSSIFRSWKDSIIVLQTTTALLPWSEELKVVSHCLDSIASKTSIDTSKVEWSYTYNRKKRPSESGNGNDLHWNGVKKHKMVPSDWWVEDLCELPIDLYKQIMTTIKTREKVSGNIIGEALNAYALRRLPGFYKGVIQGNDLTKYRSLVAAIVELLPSGKSSAACSFLLRLLRAAIMLDCGEMEILPLVKRISQQLEEATVSDLLIRAPASDTVINNVDIVKTIVEEFLKHVHRSAQIPGFDSENSKSAVAKLIDGYLVEIGCDPNLPTAKFINLAEMVSSFSRSSHDGLYRAIDTYLKEHPGISKSERKKICRLMDCRKLSADACMHAMQNERLPLRVVVQVLFFEQVRATSSSSGTNTPDGRGSIATLLAGGSHGSSRSTATNTEDDWDGVPTLDDIKALKGQLSSLRIDGAKGSTEMMGASKMKGLAMSKRILSKIWSSRERNGEISSSNTSESQSSSNAEETKSTPSRSRRHSLS